jgi:hypothetical protein
MQPAAEQDPYSGSNREPCILLLPLTEGGEWKVSFAADLENCVGRYARIPEFAQHGQLLRILNPHRDHLS